ncbi:MAG: M12 family metallo-peptidase [Planctomycetota bacterium]|nr:M12 family metallo-peptidase [Planctomycetota bacterium]
MRIVVSCVLLLCVLLSPARAQPDTPLDANLLAALAAAPPEFSGPGAVITLPLPDGGQTRVEAWDSPVMHADLAARYPQIRTFAVRGVDNPAMVGRVDLSHNGLHALLLAPGEDTVISAVPGDPARVVSRRWADVAGVIDCAVGPEHGAPLPVEPGTYTERGPLPLRTYRFAMACTGEFAVFHSERQGRPANVPDALAAIVTITNRTNAVFERDMRVRFLLVPNNDVLVFLDPATDPYDGTSSGNNLGANVDTLRARIGDANFDLGHLVTRIPGGVAYLRAACTANKAGGISGTPRTADDDPLSGEVVMHEIGHQLGANHTFNGTVGFCAGNRASSAAWEPGSGTTIMSYAGSCPIGNVPPGDNILINRDLMFHLGSIGEMVTFLGTGGGGACAGTVDTGNAAPTITGLPPASSLAIPRLTPFELTASASDPNGDTLTYSWEQFDLGPPQTLDDPDNGLSPLFRVFQPAPTGTRHFPALARVLAGEPSRGEQLPSVAGTRRFRVAVRDNHPGAGAVTTSGVISIQVVNAAPFVVTEPAPNTVLYPGPATIRWDVGGTTAPPISTLTVTARLSLDGGATYPIVLAGGRPNIGVASVVIPEAYSTNARIRLEPQGNVYRAYSGPLEIRRCTVDVDCDGNADQDDLACLAQAVAGDPSCLCVGDADINTDGNVDQDDILTLAQRIAGAPCR